MDLGVEDYASVLRAIRRLGGKRTLNGALEEWRWLVEDVEEGLDAEAAWEFMHDLGCRDWLHAAWPILTDRVRETRRAELASWDERYAAATVWIGSGCEERSGRWWHQRRPRTVLTAPGAELPPGWGDSA